MRVILLQDIKNIGKKGDVKNISDGYAKNFLLPKNLAKIATDTAVKDIETKKISEARQKEEIQKEIKGIIAKLEESEFHFYPKIGKKQEVFDSIKKTDISEQVIKKMPAKFHDKISVEVKLDKPLRTLGEHQIEVDLGFGNKAKIKVTLNQSSFE